MLKRGKDTLDGSAPFATDDDANERAHHTVHYAHSNGLHLDLCRHVHGARSESTTGRDQQL